MKKNGIYLSLIVVVIVLYLSVSLVFAITGSIGNSRMVLRDVKVGDTIEKTILVINRNEVSVNVTMSATGDLAGDIDIIDNEFILQPGEEKKAAFKIKVTKDGETESNINVLFTPLDGGNGVGLSSTIIVLASKDGNSIFEGIPEEEENEEGIGGVNIKPGGNANALLGDEGFKLDNVIIGVGLTLIMFVVLIILLVVYSRNKRGLVLEDEIKPKKRVSRK